MAKEVKATPFACRSLLFRDRRMPLTGLEISVLRASLELAVAEPEKLVARMHLNATEKGKAKGPTPLGTASVAVECLKKFLLTGRLDEASPSIARWREVQLRSSGTSEAAEEPAEEPAGDPREAETNRRLAERAAEGGSR
jgi:hypothetical protein